LLVRFSLGKKMMSPSSKSALSGKPSNLELIGMSKAGEGEFHALLFARLPKSTNCPLQYPFHPKSNNNGVVATVTGGSTATTLSTR
jgi:hypothetical protein